MVLNRCKLAFAEEGMFMHYQVAKRDFIFQSIKQNKTQLFTFRSHDIKLVTWPFTASMSLLSIYT